MAVCFIDYLKVFVLYKGKICLISEYAHSNDVETDAEIEYKISDNAFIPGIVFNQSKHLNHILVPFNWCPSERFSYTLYTILIHPANTVFEITLIEKFNDKFVLSHNFKIINAVEALFNNSYYVYKLDSLLEAKKYMVIGAHVHHIENGVFKRAYKGINNYSELYLSELKPFIIRYAKLKAE